MEFLPLFRDEGGWVILGVLAAMFVLALHRGDLVLGREYKRILSEMGAISERAERLSEEQRDTQARERQEFLERLKTKQAEIDRLTGGPSS